MENEKEILAKLQGLEEQVDILTRLLIALSFTIFQQSPRLKWCVLIAQVEKIIAEKGESVNLIGFLDELNTY